MLLTEEQLLIQKNIQLLASKVVRPFAERWAKEKLFPSDALQALSEAGLMGMLIPEQWGGAQIDAISYVLIIAELAVVKHCTKEKTYPNGLAIRSIIPWLSELNFTS